MEFDRVPVFQFRQPTAQTQSTKTSVPEVVLSLQQTSYINIPFYSPSPHFVFHLLHYNKQQVKLAQKVEKPRFEGSDEKSRRQHVEEQPRRQDLEKKSLRKDTGGKLHRKEIDSDDMDLSRKSKSSNKVEK